jgi:hypothetical protein
MMRDDTPFNLHAARRLESVRLAMLMGRVGGSARNGFEFAVAGCCYAWGTLSGGLLKQEVEIICAATEALIGTVIAYRKELAAKVPDLLLPDPYLKDSHTKLDQLADGAVIAVQQRHARSSPAGQLPVGTLNAALGMATRRANILKNRINNEIQAMALEGTLRMHEKNPPHLTNVFNGPVGNFAQNSTHFTQTANTGISTETIAQLVAEFTTHLDELHLEPRQKRRAEAQITALRAKLAGDPDPGIVRQAGRSLRNITEGSIGSLIATAAQPGVWHWVQQTMNSLF